ncbi:hypothetical protein DH2020_017937 [Rehmannia glutinosa]|uniref:Glycosyltransferase n=1 Tax=Rehmannia glutinosa TaxID=99300 RepID=A0ABR0WLM7_REHGL
MGKQSKGHAIMISVPYQGHINPFINLALKLASKGFTITFAHLEFVHQKLSKAHHTSNGTEVDLFSEARESGLDIRYATINDGFPLEFDRVLNFDEYWGIILRDFASLVDEFVGKTIQSEPFIPHAIMLAFPFQGHITPFLNLAIKLASKGFVITFAHLEFIHHMLSQTGSKTDLFSEARECGLDIRYTTIDDGFPLEFDRVLHAEEYWDFMLRDFPGRVDEFVAKTIFQAGPGLVPFLIADTLYTWPAAIAKKYKLLNEEINYLPGVESISTKDLMPYLKEEGKASIVHRIVQETFQKVKKADFILHNTIHELESGTLSALNKYQPNYAIGPINFTKNILTNTVSKSLWSESDCTHWLESKSPGSVLYVSFGSLVQISKQVIEEIAYGLLLSEVNFIWVVREDNVDSADTDAMMRGFKDEVKDRGLIIPWCNQIMVLSDRAVGGFLTHCGWNSILESMWCGVPMICYPLAYDQPTNRKLVVDNWKIGIDLCDRGISIDRKEVAKKIRDFISGPSSEVLKQEVKNVNAILQNAMDDNGSSEDNFDQFIRDLKDKLMANDEETPIMQ